MTWNSKLHRSCLFEKSGDVRSNGDIVNDYFQYKEAKLTSKEVETGVRKKSPRSDTNVWMVSPTFVPQIGDHREASPLGLHGAALH